MRTVAMFLAFYCMAFHQLLAQDPLAEIQRVHPIDLMGSAQYGRNVSTYQDRMVSGSGNNESVYVYKRVGNQFVQEIKLVPGDGPHGSSFGDDSMIYGDWIVAGAMRDSQLGTDSGAVYIFHLSNGNWVQTQKIVAFDGWAGYLFGCSVEIDGDVMVVGAIGSGAGGAVYVYRLINGVWTFAQKLLQPDGEYGDYFGNCVDVEGSIIAVNSRGDDDGGSNAGAVLTYELVGNQFVFTSKIIPADVAADDLFGYNLSLGEGRLIAGSCMHDANALNSGAAYIYSKVGGVWTLQQKLIPNDPGMQRFFGRSVAIHDGMAVIGASLDNSHGYHAGSAYIFDFTGSSWTFRTKVFASDSGQTNEFGIAVDINDSWVVIGAYGNTNNEGSSYIFHENSIVPSASYAKLHGVDWDPLGFVIPAPSSIDLTGAEFVLEARQGTTWIEVARESVAGNQMPRLFDEGVVKYSATTDYRLYIVDSLQFSGPFSSILIASRAADLNNDGVINKQDKVLFIQAMGSVEGGPNWNLQADLIVDGKINEKDEQAFLSWFQ